MKLFFSNNKHSLLYLLTALLFICIMLTNVLHNNVVDTILTIINTALIVKIILILSKSLFSSVNSICNP